MNQRTDAAGSSSSARASSKLPKFRRRRFLVAAAGNAALFLHRQATRAATQKPWRVAIIGHTGRGNYGHGLHTLWANFPDATIVGLADADAEGREQARQLLGLSDAFADYREMLLQTKPDIVVVAPRHLDQHRDMAVAAAESGARGIYCEKPFCRTPAEADDIVTACQQRNVKLAIAHRNRYHPALPVVEEAVRSGELGRLLEIRCRGLEDQRGGAEDLWVLGTHLLDLARCFAGNAVACSAVLLQGQRPVTAADVVGGAEGIGPIAGDRLHARYEMDSGIPVYFDSIRGTGSKSNFGLELVGTSGVINLRIDREPLAHIVRGNPFLPTHDERVWVPISSAGIGRPEPIEDLQRLVSEHVFAVRDLMTSITEDRQPLSSAEDGRAIVEMVHAAFASHVQNGARVALPLAEREHALKEWLPKR